MIAPDAVVSSAPPGVRYEVWLYVPPPSPGASALHAPVQELGLFADHREACRVGATLRLWFHLGVWAHDVFGPLLAAHADPAGDRAGLMSWPADVRALGFDPARVVVTVPEFLSASDNDHEPDAGYDRDYAPGW